MDDTIHSARVASAAPTSALLAPAGPGGRAVPLTERSAVFDHCAVLLFPRTLAAGLAELRRCGFAPLPLTPSTVVRGRLSARHGFDPAESDIHITRLPVRLADGRHHPAVEVFLFPRDSPAFRHDIEDAEVAHDFEAHTAFVMSRPDPAALSELIAAWRGEAGLLWEGGGHNPHEGGPSGATVLYFVRGHAAPAQRRRFELHCAGDLRPFIDRLPYEAEAVDRAYRTWRAFSGVPA
ncbi:hypothetical protein AB0J80_04115 [Actinoplanes sp. NPDC049548]|uniref:hypothetical protein n=1 Tax=Actinoplanes sp. NPDC049548 TaxID=3155152 RepID=UPI00342035F9